MALTKIVLSHAFRHGKQTVAIPTSFTVDDEALVGEIGVSRMNDLDFALEIRLSIYAELRPPFFPSFNTVQQTQIYVGGKYKYQCHFGNQDPEMRPSTHLITQVIRAK